MQAALVIRSLTKTVGSGRKREAGRQGKLALLFSFCAGAAASPGPERDGSNLVRGIKGGREVRGVLRHQPAGSERSRIPK